MNNLAKSFVDYMEDVLELGTFGEDIFIGSLPEDAPTPCYWVKTAGGSPVTVNSTGEKVKRHTLEVFYRNVGSEDVYNKLQAFEEAINSSEVTELDPYTVYNMEAVSFPTDQDLDAPERTVGMVQVAIEIYQ